MDAGTIKPAMWCPGRNGHELWRGCVGYWPLWDGVGATARDLSGNSNDGTLTDMDPSTDWISDIYGPCLDFDGGDDYLQFPTSIGFASSEPLTASAYVYVRSLADYQGIWTALSSAPWPGWAFYVHADGSFGTYMAAHYLTAANVLITGDWYLLMLTYDGDKLVVYRDGEALRTDTGVSYTGTSVGVRFGRFIAEGVVLEEYWDGPVAWAGLWNYALEPGQIAKLAADPFCMIRQPSFAPFWDVGPSLMKAIISVGGVHSSIFDGIVVRG